MATEKDNNVYVIAPTTADGGVKEEKKMGIFAWWDRLDGIWKGALVLLGAASLGGTATAAVAAMKADVVPQSVFLEHVKAEQAVQEKQAQFNMTTSNSQLQLRSDIQHLDKDNDRILQDLRFLQQGIPLRPVVHSTPPIIVPMALPTPIPSVTP